MYVVSDQWVAEHIIKATQCGYVTLAFGLRLRTPILHRTIMNSRVTPYEAQQEARTAGNALGQSWGMLNNRAALEFFDRCKAAGYLHKVLPVAHIHDACYFMVSNDMEVITWVNKNLPECMAWQDDPLIQHDQVKLGGNLEVFYPNWGSKLKLPVAASIDTIRSLAAKHAQKLKEG